MANPGVIQFGDSVGGMGPNLAQEAITVADPAAAAAQATGNAGPRFGQVALQPLGTGADDSTRLVAVLNACAGQFPVIQLPGAWHVDAGIVADPHKSTSSLVHGKLDALAWRVYEPTLAPLVRSFYADTAKYPPTRSKLWVNYDSLCPVGGYLERPVMIPAGVTGIQIELDELSQGPGGATGDVYLELYDATGSVAVASEAFTPGASPADVATAEIAVTAGLEYRVRVVCNTAGVQSTFVCGAIRVRPTTSTDSFWLSTFVRIDVDAACIQDNLETIAYDNPRFGRQTAYCHVDIDTDAASVRVEAFNNVGDILTGTYDDLAVFCDGYALDPVAPTPNGNVSFCTVAIPTSGSARHLSIYAGIQLLSTYTTLGVTENRGVYLCAVYVPFTGTTRVATGQCETIVLYGDSKFAGGNETYPAITTFAQTLRERGYRVISETVGSKALAYDVGTTLTVAACTPYAMKLARHQPTQVFVGVGRNDFAQFGTFTPANLVTQLGNFIDALHVVAPQAQVKLVTWTSETTETAVSGVAWDTERANIAALSSSRSAWCSVLDAARMWSTAEAATFTQDGIHPTEGGYDRLTRIVAAESYPWTPGQIPDLLTWVEGDANIAGDEMTAVTAGGPAPPAVTLTGTAVRAFHLLIQMWTAGTLGVATFRWSVDGGRSWVGQPLTTGADVVLGSTGITAHFAAGSYGANTYDSDTYISGWNALGGTSSFIKLNDATRPSFNSVASGNKPGPNFAANAINSALQISGISVPAPWSFWVVAKLVNAAAIRTPVHCTAAAGVGGVMYRDNTRNATYFYDGGGEGGQAVDETALHSHICIGNPSGGAQSNIRIDGVDGLFSPHAVTLTAITLGQRVGTGWPWDGPIMAFAFKSGAFTVDECLALEARARSKWGTP